MKNKIKKIKIRKSHILCFIIGVLISGLVGVGAVTYFASGDVSYDNTASGLKSTDVQSAIDELYNECALSATSGNYLYYAVNSYNNNISYFLPISGTLYKCNLDGSNCTEIKSVSSSGVYGYSFGNVYANNDYLYFAVNQYRNYTDKGYYAPYSGTLYKCNLDGSNCTEIKSVSSSGVYGYSFGNVYTNKDYLYYAVNQYRNYTDKGYYAPYSGTLYKCNLDGSSCTEIKSASGSTSGTGYGFGS